MRLPVPNNKLVAFTLAGALLTGIIAGALAAPTGPLMQSREPAGQSGAAAADTPQPVAADAPTPNPNLTPAVQAQSGYEGEEDEADDDDEEDEEQEEAD